MKHEVQTILASVCPGAKPIVSMRLRYWRAIHSEFMTHRVFSRNASSSRAIPVTKLALTSEDDMFIPKFRINKPGMQPGEFVSPETQGLAEGVWKDAADKCLEASKSLAALGVHKQWANRPLEWFGYINVLVTSTEWDNFFTLRLETDEEGFPIPQDEMYDLACTMQREYARACANVRVLKPGEWHLPYLTNEDRAQLTLEQQKRVSAARCASISYQTVDGKPMTIDKAIDLCENKLIARQHWSPFEHQAMADEQIQGSWAHRALHGNFEGYAQWRHFLAENL